MNKTFLNLLLIFALLAIGGGGFLFLLSTRDAVQPAVVEEKTWLVSTQTVEKQALSPQVLLYGQVESPQVTQLRVPSLSTINNIAVVTVGVREGEQVEEGALLLKLDERDTQLNLQQRQADRDDLLAQIETEKQQHANNLASLKNEQNLLRLTQQSVERAKQLKQRQATSQSALDDAQRSVEQQQLSLNRLRTDIRTHQARLTQLQARLKRAEALRELSKLELARLEVRAPYAGLVSSVEVAIGNRVRSGDALLSMYPQESLEVRAQLPEYLHAVGLRSMQMQQPLQATANWQGQKIELYLNRLAAQINPQEGGIDGFFAINAGREWLRLGQFLRLDLNLPTESDVVPLPITAIYGAKQIYRLVDDRMQRLDIQRVGEYVTEDGEKVVLVRHAELQDGDSIITTYLPNALDGLRVTTAEFQSSESDSP